MIFLHLVSLLITVSAALPSDNQSLKWRNVEARAEGCTSSACPAPLSAAYMSFNQMVWYMKQLNATYYPRVKLSSIGKSVQGRSIWLMTVTKSGQASSARKAVWIEGGIHAREWISPATTLHLLHQVATTTSFDNLNFDYYFVPMANPDGYVYSQTTDRLWRKNRALISGSTCVGVDLNRNWDDHYGVGASTDPCTEVYQGPKAFSEPETVALSQKMKSIGNLTLVLAIHSYGQNLLYPHGWTTTPPTNVADLIRVGKAFNTTIARSGGLSYNVVNAAAGLYFAAGATDDWSYDVLGVPYVYTLELPDVGVYGFELPASQISPTATQVAAGFKAMLGAI